MDKMIVVVFDNEIQAYEGSKALQDLHSEGTIFLYAKTVITRDTTEKVEVKQQDDMGPVGTSVGLLTGTLIGVIGGPVGVVVGASAGTLGGMVYDLANLGVGQDFLYEIEQSLQPGTSAIVAEIEEEWTLPLDTRMEELGGVVIRRTRREYMDEQVNRDVAAIEADRAELKAEISQANGEAKSKLQKKIDATNEKMRTTQENFQAGLEAKSVETAAKIMRLEDQVAQDMGERKAKREARIAEMKADQKRRSDQLKESAERAKESLPK